MLETGEVSSLREIAQLERLDNSYISRMVNLTTLAPDIVEAILDDCLPPNITLFDLAVDPPRLWSEQRERGWLGYQTGGQTTYQVSRLPINHAKGLRLILRLGLLHQVGSYPVHVAPLALCPLVSTSARNSAPTQ